MSAEKNRLSAYHGAGETAYDDIDQASTTGSAALLPKDQRPSAISLLNILRWCGTVCRLIAERYRQRKQLMEMDYRQLKDIGITPEEAQQEARKPIWKN